MNIFILNSIYLVDSKFMIQDSESNYYFVVFEKDNVFAPDTRKEFYKTLANEDNCYIIFRTNVNIESIDEKEKQMQLKDISNKIAQIDVVKTKHRLKLSAYEGVIILPCDFGKLEQSLTSLFPFLYGILLLIFVISFSANFANNGLLDLLPVYVFASALFTFFLEVLFYFTNIELFIKEFKFYLYITTFKFVMLLLLLEYILKLIFHFLNKI